MNTEQRHWRNWNTMSVECEVADLLLALVVASKPLQVVESGGGHSSEALAMGLTLNRMGTLTVYEPEEKWFEAVTERLVGHHHATTVQGVLPDPLPAGTDMVFLDSAMPRRDDELKRCLDLPILLVVHDTRIHENGIAEMKLTGCNLWTARGLWMRDHRTRRTK